MTDDYFAKHHYFIGDEKTGGWRASVHSLKTGGFCYELEHVTGTPRSRYFFSYGFFGDFPTVEDCLADARERQAKLKV